MQFHFIGIQSYRFFFFFLILFIYLFIFIYGCVGSSPLCEGFLQLRQVGATVHHGAQASHHRGLSCWRSTDSRCAGSVIVAHGRSCSASCGIFPDQGSNPCPLHWQADSQPLRHQESPKVIISYQINCKCSSVKTILSLQTVQKQIVGQIWPMSVVVGQTLV